jgi:HEPN domain-containing protein
MQQYEIWLEYAKSNYHISKIKNEGIRYTDLCYEAQQSVEKALKGLLIYFKVDPKYTHNIEHILVDIEKFVHIPKDIAKTISLTKYATKTRYPGAYGSEYQDVTQKEYAETIKITEQCLDWVDKIIALHLATLKTAIEKYAHEIPLAVKKSSQELVMDYVHKNNKKLEKNIKAHQTELLQQFPDFVLHKNIPV